MSSNKRNILSVAAAVLTLALAGAAPASSQRPIFPVVVPDTRDLQVDQPITDWVGAWDRDRFRVWLDSEKMYAIAVDRLSGTLDPRLFLRNHQGWLLEEADGRGFDGSAVLHFSPTTDGYYLIGVGSFGRTRGEYRLLVREEPPAAFVGPLRAVVVGQPTRDFLEVADRDRFQVWMDAGRAYVIRADRTAGHLDPQVFVFANSGRVVAQDDDSGLGDNALLHFRPEVTGNYLIEVHNEGDTSGDYRLLVR